MASNKGPQFVRFLQPILTVLKESGGALPAAEVADRVIEGEGISEEELSVVLKNGQQRVKNQVYWARMYLVHAGLLKNETRGRWELTESGYEADIGSHAQAIDLFRSVQSRFKRKPGSEQPSPKDEPDDEVAPAEDQHRAELISLLQTGISAAGFERLCKRVLGKAGLEDIEITGKAGDKGIDGFGYLNISSLITEKVLFQCKRYGSQNPVTPDRVREFRGAIQNVADKGIIVTTSRFTKEAKTEALKYPPIETIDGDQLVELFERFGLGLKAKTVYDIDYGFFDAFRD